MRLRYTISFILFAAGTHLYSQVGGTYTYAFLNQANSARVASLGGKSVAIPDPDLNLPFHNPALLDSGMHNHVVMNYVGYFADIGYGYVSYARNLNSKSNIAAGIHYIDYGSFPYADEGGIRYGNFTAREYALNLFYSYRIDSFFTIGANLKPIYSVFESYHSTGLAFDLGGAYHHPEKLFTAGFVIRNAGVQLTTYYGEGEREPLPLEIQAGVSQKLAHAPFRFSLTLQHLQKWKLGSETVPDDGFPDDPYTNQTARTRMEEFGDQLLRHTIFGIEFIPGKNFYVSAGYNYNRRQEMKISTRPAMVGFSWGFGLRISKFNLSYGRATYHLAGASNHFTLGANLSEFYRRN